VDKTLVVAVPACSAGPAIAVIRYAAGRFDLDNAKGPIRLDLGDVLYAPNVMRDDYGRVIMWGWLQERRTVRDGSFSRCTYSSRPGQARPGHP
jgi:hypothetical protein